MAGNIDQSGNNSNNHTFIMDLFSVFPESYSLMLEGGIMVHKLRYNALLSAVESFIKNALDVQVTDESSPDYGGFRCPDHLICESWSAVNTFATMVIIFFNPDSRYSHSQSLLDRMKTALNFIKRSQNDDGKMNIYFTGEIGTTSNLAYILNTLLKSYRLLLRDNGLDEIQNSLEQFLKKCVDTLKDKVAENTTERLVTASALIDYDKLFFDHLASSKAQSYLTDRVSINHDGMYSDKNSGLSMLSNAVLLNIAKKLNRSYMIEYVRRNLNFNMYDYPNYEEIDRYCMQSYSPFGYAVWKEMSIIDHNGYYATAGDMLLEKILNSMKDGYAHCHTDNALSGANCRDYSSFFFTSNIGEYLLVEEELENDGVHRLPFPTNYEKTFYESNIVRIRKKKVSATIRGNSRKIFSIENGQVSIQHLRISYNCNGYRYFEPKKLETNLGSYVLRDWHYNSQPDLQPNIISLVDADLSIIAEFNHDKDYFEIRLSANGMKGIPFFIEFGIRRRGKISINETEVNISDVGIVPMNSEEACIKCGDDSLTISGGVNQHRMYRSEDIWTRSLKTASIMITPITPFSKTIQMHWG